MKKIPKRLKPLLEDGIIDTVIRPIMSGKEAEVFLVRSGGEARCAKVYKDVTKRSFQNSSMYREGRVERNSRRARAMAKRTTYGRREEEDSWQNAEVEALYKLAEAGVRVPKPHGCFDGVMLMDLVADSSGEIAPRLAEVEMDFQTAFLYHKFLIGEMVKMLCCGLIHGDLSEYNILIDADGPVIIDLPQAVDAAGNNNAKMIFSRDINNLKNFFGRFNNDLLKTNYAEEIWEIFEAGKLRPEIKLTGHFKDKRQKANVKEVLKEIEEAREEAEEREAFLSH